MRRHRTTPGFVVAIVLSGAAAAFATVSAVRGEIKQPPERESVLDSLVIPDLGFRFTIDGDATVHGLTVAPFDDQTCSPSRSRVLALDDVQAIAAALNRCSPARAAIVTRPVTSEPPPVAADQSP